MEDWILLSDRKPERGEDVEVLNSDGTSCFAYLCEHCGSEWRCSMSGYGLMIDPIKWRLRRIH